MIDQTEADIALEAGSMGLGTAVLLVRQQDGSKQKFLQRAAYDQFIELGRNPAVLAGKWVPERVMPLAALASASCHGVACVDRCVHPGCVCDLDLKQCV